MRLPQPTFHKVGSLKDREFEEFNVIAIPATFGTSAPEISKSPLIVQVLEYCGITREEFKKLFPEFQGKPSEVVRIPVAGHKTLVRILVVGHGDAGREASRKAGAAIGRAIKGTGYRVLDTFTFAAKEDALAHIMAVSLSQYGWNLKSQDLSDKKVRAKGATQISFPSQYANEITRASIHVNAVWHTRDLIHTPANIKTPAWLGEQAKNLVRQRKSSALTVTIKSGRALAKFGGLRAVGNSSPTASPRLIEVSYAPIGSKNWPHVVLVGKGITFDTGGLSLKRPYDLMIPMKSDMAGAAAILTATVAMAEIKPRVRVTALLMCAENMISGTAQRPSDVITQYGGTTVEIINTDAEGRLVLADGLAYADLELNPDYLLDVATLTGSASLGLGKQYGAMFSRNTSLSARLHQIGESIGDRVWPMPLVDDYTSALASKVADLNHDASAQDFSAGSVTAALFLEKFVGERTWVHLDIAGPARSDSDSGEVIKGGTGFGPRLLIEWLASLS